MQFWKNLLITVMVICGIVGLLVVIQSLSDRGEKGIGTSRDNPSQTTVSVTSTPAPQATPTPQEEITSGIPYRKQPAQTNRVSSTPSTQNTGSEGYQAGSSYSKKDIIYTIAKRHDITITSYKEEVVGKPTITGVAPVHNAFGDFLDELISEIGMKDFNEDRDYFKKMTTKDGRWLYRAKFTISYY